jgi:hypothetical protein
MARPRLHLKATNPKVDIEVEMGDGPATPSAGYSAVEVVNRIGQPAATAFEGVQPFQQDVPILLDGFRENHGVQRQVDTVLSLGGETIFWADGPIFEPGKRYIFGDEPEFGEMLRDGDGTLLRCRLTLKLMRYVPADQAGTRPKRRRGIAENVAVGGTVTVTGRLDTLTKIAAHLFNDPSKWRVLSTLNGIKDPNKKLEIGRRLKV